MHSLTSSGVTPMTVQAAYGDLDSTLVPRLLHSCDMCGGISELSRRNLALEEIILQRPVSA